MSVKSTLLAAYLLGRSEHPVSEGMLDDLVSKLDDDVVRLETEVVVLKRKVDDSGAKAKYRAIRPTSLP